MRYPHGKRLRSVTVQTMGWAGTAHLPQRTVANTIHRSRIVYDKGRSQGTGEHERIKALAIDLAFVLAFVHRPLRSASPGGLGERRLRRLALQRNVSFPFQQY